MAAAVLVLAGCGDGGRGEREARLTDALVAACDEGAVTAARLEEQVARLERRAPDLTVPAGCR